MRGTEKEIGRRIRLKRRKLGMTQIELSKRLGVSSGYLSLLERGNRRLSGKMIRLLHKELEISYDYLLEGKEETNAEIKIIVP